MKVKDAIDCYCHDCERQWNLSLTASIDAFKNKSYPVYCPFCSGARVTTTDKDKAPQKTSLKEINEWQQDSLTAFRDRFCAASNMEALDKIDSLKLNIDGMHSDAIKYPQLALHDYHFNRLENMREAFQKT